MDQERINFRAPCGTLGKTYFQTVCGFGFRYSFFFFFFLNFFFPGQPCGARALLRVQSPEPALLSPESLDSDSPLAACTVLGRWCSGVGYSRNHQTRPDQTRRDETRRDHTLPAPAFLALAPPSSEPSPRSSNALPASSGAGLLSTAPSYRGKKVKKK